METRVQYVLVGLFVIVLSAAGIGISLWLAFGDIATDYRTYKIYMTESVSGLYRDAPVRYHGVEVGKVRQLELDPINPQRVIVTVDVEKDIPIRVDTLATLKVQGLTGIASVELSGGKVSSPLVAAEPGEEYPVIDTGPSLFSRLDNAISALAGDFNQIAKDLHELLNPDNRAAVSATLDNMARFSGTLADQRQALESSMQDAARFFAGAAEAGEGFPELVGQMQDSARALEVMAQDFASTSQTLRQQVQASGQGVNQVTDQLVPQFNLLLQDLRQMSDDMQRLAESLEENPSQLIYGEPRRAPGPGEMSQ